MFWSVSTKRMSVSSEASIMGVWDVPRPSTILAIASPWRSRVAIAIRASIHLDIGGLGHCCPFLQLGRDKGAERVRCYRMTHGAQPRHGLLHLRRRNGLVDRRIELGHDVLGRAGRRHEAVERRH